MSATLPPRAAAAVRRPRRSLRFTRDDELVRLLRAGDVSAFEALYDRHHRGILSFCRHMLGSREEAEDAVQHTFAAAHRNLVETDKPIQLKAWLYAIARNRCLSMLRARREERSLEDAPEPSVDGLAAEVQRRQDLREMLDDLQRLPDDQRAALVLAELGDLSHEEIAEAIGVRTGKVKALVFQARESLAGSKAAREADCKDIQEQLAVLRGGSLRRTTLRRHVAHCPACTAFKAEVQRQRSAMAAILPVVPTVALKEGVLGAVLGGGAAGGGAAASGVLGGGGGMAAKVLTVVAVSGGAAGGGVVAVEEIRSGRAESTAVAQGALPEARTAQLVGQLRERARAAGAERAADRLAAHGRSGADGTRERPSGAGEPSRRAPASAGARPAVQREDAPSARTRPVSTGDTRRRTGVETSRGRVEPPSGQGAPEPVAPPSPAPAQQPAAVAAPPPPEDAEPRKGKGRKKARKPKAQTGSASVPAARRDEEDGQDHDGHERGDDGDGERRRGRRPAPAVPAAAPPQPAVPKDDGDDDGGKGRGGEHGDGDRPGHAGEQGDGDGEDRGPSAFISRVLGALRPR